MNITKQHIEIYRKAGGCNEALAWAEEEPRTYAEAKDDWRVWAAWHPSTPVDVLATLSKDGNSDVRSGVAQNPASSPEVLTALAKDTEPVVRFWAQRNLDQKGAL